MAALAGCGIHNALIDIDGPEVPILDGSSAQFVKALLSRGLRQQGEPVRVLQILKPVEVRKGEAWARLTPADELRIDFHIDFVDAAIGVQEKGLQMANGAFVRELSDSRTFCRRSDVEWMQANGLALGGVPGKTPWCLTARRSKAAKVCVTRMSLCATRCWMRLAIWHWQGPRFWAITPATALAMRSPTICCGRCLPSLTPIVW